MTRGCALIIHIPGCCHVHGKVSTLFLFVVQEGDKVVYLGKGSHYGCVATVLPDLGAGLSAAGKVAKRAGEGQVGLVGARSLYDHDATRLGCWAEWMDGSWMGVRRAHNLSLVCRSQ